MFLTDGKPTRCTEVSAFDVLRYRVGLRCHGYLRIVVGGNDIVPSKWGVFDATPSQVRAFVIPCSVYSAMGIAGLIDNSKNNPPMRLSHLHGGLLCLCVVAPFMALIIGITLR